MEEESEQLHFEAAAKIRDQIAISRTSLKSRRLSPQILLIKMSSDFTAKIIPWWSILSLFEPESFSEEKDSPSQP